MSENENQLSQVEAVGRLSGIVKKTMFVYCGLFMTALIAGASAQAPNAFNPDSDEVSYAETADGLFDPEMAAVPDVAFAAAPQVMHGKIGKFAVKTANQVHNLTSAGVVPDMSMVIKVKQKGNAIIQFCSRWYSNSNLSIVRLKARVDGVNAEPSTVHVVPVANFSGTGKHQLRCFNWAVRNLQPGLRTVSIYNNPTGNALVYERTLLVMYRK